MPLLNNMDPQTSLLFANEMKAIQDEINDVRNGGITEEEKRKKMNDLTIYGRTLLFFFEEFPRLVERIQQTQKARKGT